VAVDLNRPITWASIARIGLFFGAEYGVLALIEDAPFAVKIATVVCSLAALAALEARDWLNRTRTHLFPASMIVLGAVYLGFVGYAAVHAAEQLATRRGLERIYVESGHFYERQLPLKPNSNACAEEGVQKFDDDVASWEKDSASWIAEHMGEAARDRFLDQSDALDINYGACGGGYRPFNQVMNRLRRDRKNLSVIIESKAYYGD
jgi:hypothetical protein